MAGRPGRSGGHNKIPIDLHLARGTYVASRHAARAAAERAVGLTLPEPMPADLLDGLEGRGRVFVERTWAAYSGWSPPELALLHEAGRVITELEALRGQPSERAAQRLLVSLVAQLRVT